MVEKSVNGGLKVENPVQVDRIDGGNLSSIGTTNKYFSLKHPDNFYFVENNVYKIKSIKYDDEYFVCGQLLLTEKALFGNDVKYCKERLIINGPILEHKFSDVKKIVKVKLKNELFFISLIHD